MGIFDNEKEEEHPSYGVIQFSRTTHGPQTLFGSRVPTMTSIRMKVSKAKYIRNTLTHDTRIWPTDLIVELDLSPAQFAELITSLNVGVGVPCTVRHLGNYKRIEDPPLHKSDIEKVNDETKEKLGRIGDLFREQNIKLDEILTKPRVGKKDCDEIRSLVARMQRVWKDSLPFAIDQMNKAAEKIVGEAKAEVDAVLSTVATKLGFEVMKNDPKAAEKVLLLEGDDQGSK